jgi:hypothetical protein
MGRWLRRSNLGATVVLIGLLAACGDDRPDVQPSPIPQTVPPPPPSPSGPNVVVSFLRVTGPTLVPPGESAQFSATATLSDGSNRDITHEAEWSSTDEAVLSVSSAGVASGRSNGQVQVAARFQGASDGRQVIVVPSGRFVLRTAVSDGHIPNHPLLGARVEVISGPASGLAATTNWEGFASLFGVPADVEIEVSKDGYEPVRRSIHLTNITTGHFVSLVPIVDRPVLTGRFQLTIAAGDCADGGVLPEVARSRTYTAAIYEPGGNASVRLTGANFVIKQCSSSYCPGGQGDTFTGLIGTRDVRFTLVEYYPGDDDYYGTTYTHPSVLERLADGTMLTFSGRAIVTPTSGGFSGTLDGRIAILSPQALTAHTGVVLNSCESTSHRFTLVR